MKKPVAYDGGRCGDGKASVILERGEQRRQRERVGEVTTSNDVGDVVAKIDEMTNKTEEI